MTTNYLKKIAVLFLMALINALHLDDALAYNSMDEFEARSTTSSGFGYLGSLDDCFSSGKVVYPGQYSQFDDICIPTMISSDTKDSCKGVQGSITNTLNIGRAIAYGTFLKAFPIGTIIAFLAMGVEYTMMVDVCTNTYVIAPHEFINLETMGGMKYDETNKRCVPSDDNKKAFNSIDIPFYYHCDPYYQPAANKQAAKTLKDGDDEELIGRTWGYMGAASPYCAGDASQYARKTMIGTIVVQYMSGWDRFWGSSRTRCNSGGSGTPTRKQEIIRPGEDKKWLGPTYFSSYYKFDFDISKVQICVAAPILLFPIKVGCSYVPPPVDDSEIDKFLETYLQDTRCYYFIKGRQDLMSLGLSLEDNDDQGIKKIYVKDFLKSDMHVISTIVGCMQDLLVKVFIDPSVSTSSGSASFFQIIQSSLQDIVYAVLILYLCIVGINIAIASRVPERGQMIMYVVKFALVIYFGTGSVWYSLDNNGKKDGLYPALISASSEIAGFFMGAQNDNDPIGFCRYSLDKSNIFQERLISTSILKSSAKETKGFPGSIKMTVWDLIDCKLLNYLNLGSCKYSISGLIGIWIIGAAFFVGLSGFLLSIVSFIYCFMLLMVIFKFTHIFILSMFVLTILVLVSPIMVCFALFDYTKEICSKWMSMILGYVLYPALLFAFVALMLATFDSVYYGDLNLQGKKDPVFSDITEACKNTESIFCLTYSSVKNDPCESSIGFINGTLTRSVDTFIFGRWTFFVEQFADPYMIAMLQLMLFAFLFYLFMGSVTSFLALLTGVQDLSSMASGGNMVGAAASAASSLYSAGKSAFGSKK